MPSLNDLNSVAHDLSKFLFGYIAQSSLYYHNNDFSEGWSLDYIMGPLKQVDLFKVYSVKYLSIY